MTVNRNLVTDAIRQFNKTRQEERDLVQTLKRGWSRTELECVLTNKFKTRGISPEFRIHNDSILEVERWLEDTFTNESVIFDNLHVLRWTILDDVYDNELVIIINSIFFTNAPYTFNSLL